MKLIRTQVQLTDQQLQALRQLSARSGRSISDLVRQGIDDHLRGRAEASDEERKQRAIRIAGMFASGQTDVSSKHDQYLADAFGK